MLPSYKLLHTYFFKSMIIDFLSIVVSLTAINAALDRRLCENIRLFFKKFLWQYLPIVLHMRCSCKMFSKKSLS